MSGLTRSQAPGMPANVFRSRERQAQNASSAGSEKRVKTHCCFCGVQCGITVKVRENRIVGYEPRVESPVNQGRLCSKAIKRYNQGSYPGRLTECLRRDGHGEFSPVSWNEAFERTVSEIKRIQAAHGSDSIAFLGGASMTNEKAYLNGKFARLALKTSNIDYNGRLCMVSAGLASRIAFGLDRSANPWSDISKAECVFVAGSNMAESFPILTQGLWDSRDRGGKLVVVDPRRTAIAKAADIHLPIKPGTDLALANGILREMLVNDWIDEVFVSEHCHGFDDLRGVVSEYDLERVEAITNVPRERIQAAAKIWGEAKTSMLLQARGVEQHVNGTENTLGYINMVLASGRIGREGCGYSALTGQGNGQGAREQGQRCNQLPGGRDIGNPEHRHHMADFWGIPESDLPGEGLSACEIIEGIETGSIKGLISIGFNPLVSLPDSERTRKALEALEFYGAIDFVLSETARYANIVFAGSMQEEDEGTVTTGEGRCVRLNRSVLPEGDAREDWDIISELGRRLRESQQFQYEGPRQLFEEYTQASKGGPVDYSGMTLERIEDEQGIFWPCPEPNHPGTARLFEGGLFAHDDGKAVLTPVDYRHPAEPTDEAFPLILTTGRVIAHYLSGSITRRIKGLVEQCAEPVCELHPSLAERHGIVKGNWIRLSTRRAGIAIKAKITSDIRPDTVFAPFYWGGENSVNRLTLGALDPMSKIPGYKCCACRIERLDRLPES